MKNYSYQKCNLIFSNCRLLIIMSMIISLITLNAHAQITVVSGGVGLNPSYPSLTTASGLFAALNAGAQTGEVIVISVDADVTTEDGAIALNNNDWTSISITPNGTRTLSGTVAGKPLIDYNGADNVTIDGLNASGNSLVISNLSTSNTAGTSTIRFINDATSNTIQNCTISGSGTSATNGTVFFSTTTGTSGNDNNIINNNLIGPAGANLPTNGIYSLGTTTVASNYNSGIQITNNKIFDFFNNTASTVAIGVFATTGSSDWTITGNSIYQTATRTFSASTTGFIGISVNYTSGNNFDVSNNYVGGSAALAGGTAWTQAGAFTHTFIGIRLSVGTTTPSSVQGNVIQNISITTSTTSSVNAGIAAISGSLNIGTISGNIIGSTTGTGSIIWTGAGSGATLCGILTGTGTPNAITVSNNLIGGVTIAGTGTTTFRGIRCEGSVVTSLTISNNLIGSLTTANSIQSNSNTSLVGISSTNTGQPISINTNTIANLQSTATTTSASLRGIEATGSVSGQNISGNTLRNFSTTSTNTGTTTTASIVGILLTGSSTSGNLITNNTIKDFSNTTAGASAVYVTGILITSTPSTTISRNFIYNMAVSSTSNTSACLGIYLFNSSATENIHNNMIRLGTGLSSSINPIVRGIYDNTATGSPTNIIHNTIYIGGTQGSNTVNTACVHRSVASTMDIKNNILWNDRASTGVPGAVAGRHYAIQASNITGTFTSNSNILYTPNNGGTIGLYTSDRNTLFDWQSGSGKDGASFSSDPKLLDPTNATAPDLHINPVPITAAEGNGVLISPPTDDFDGETRAGLTPVDIGADAGNFTGADLSAPVITYTLLGNTSSTSNRITSAFATITDASGINVAPGTAPRIYYKKSTDLNNTFNDNTASTVGWKYAESTTGSSPFDFTIDYSLLNNGPVVVGDVIQYFVVAQDLAAPNVGINAGTFTSIPASVALTAAAFPIGGTINSYSVLPAISGTLVVPSVTYPSLTIAGGAFAAINSSVVTGDITIEIAGDLAGETGAVQLNEFASPFTVTIKPTGSAHTISGTSTGSTALITLNGADRVTIDGSLGSTANTICPASTASRDLTISNSNTSTTSAVIWLQTATGPNGATNNTIKNCNITGNSNITTLFGIGAGSTTISTTSLGNGNNNNSYINNNVSKTQFGIYSQGPSLANKNTGTVINQNLINTAAPDNVAKGGIWIGFDNGAVISANRIENLLSSSDLFAITLGMGASFSNSTTAGNEVINATVTKNVINNITNTGTNSAAGISLSTAASGTTLIANNMIGGVSANGTSTDFAAGILLGGGTGSTTLIYYNTVWMNGTIQGGTAGSTQSFALAVTNSTAPVLDIQNNILVNTQLPNAGGTTKFYSIGLAYSSTAGNYAGLTSNNNDFFSGTGANYFTAITGGLSAGTTRTLASWQTETGRDGGGLSHEFLPVFTSATDLHLVAADPINLPLYNGAVTVSVTDDIDCDTRATDIGADEFFPPACGAVNAGSVSATDNGPFCGTGSSTLSFTGVVSGVGLSYQWQSSPDNTFATPTNLGTAATQAVTPGIGTTFYRCTVSCSDDGSTSTTSPDFSLTVYPIPTAIINEAGPISICAPNTQLLTSATNAGVPAYQWASNGIDIGGETNSSYTVTASGSYTIRVTENGCSATSSAVEVTVNPEVLATATGPATPICLGQETTLSATATAGIPGMPGFNVSASSGSISLSVPDNSLTGVTQSVSLSGAGLAVVDATSVISVTVSATQTFNADLDFYLVGPGDCGTLELSTDNGSTGDNYAGAILVTPSGATNINTLTGAANNITGIWKAEGNYNTAPALNSGTGSGSYVLPAVAIAGCPIDGNWTLFVADDANNDFGTVTQFDLNITNNIVGNFTDAFSGGSGTFSATSYSGANNTTGSATITPTVAGVNNYTVITTAPSGCSKTNIVSVTVNDPNDGNPCTYDFCNTTNGVVTNVQPVHNVTTGLDYCTLQAALNDPATTNGDVINIVVPNHTEGQVTVTKDVTIDGLNNTLTSTSPNYGIEISTTGVTLQNLTIKEAGTFGIQVDCGSDNLTLTNVTVDNSGGTGIGLNGSDNALITNLISTNNGGNGISITDCNNTTINGITTFGNSFGGGFNAGIGLFTSGVYCPPAGINGFTLTGAVSIAEVTKVYSQKTNASQVITGLSGATIQWAVGIAALDRSYWPDKATAYAVVDALFEPPFSYPNSIIYVAEVATENFYVNDDPNGDATPPMLIQAAVNFQAPVQTIFVESGTYNEDVNVTKTLNILGAGAGTTSVFGVFGGDGATFRISANNVEISGFTITRLGNNTTDWNDPTLNSAGIAIQGTSFSGALIHDNIITGNRTGIDINNSSTHTIRNNDITFNRTGLIFRNQTDNLTIVENNINDNWTIGVLFLDGSVGTNVPVQTALNSNINNNNISGNWYGQIQDRQSGGALPAPGTNLKNFTCNWYGTTSPVKTNVNTTEPGYAAQIPVAYGGSAVPPGGQPDIEGTASDNLVYVPYLISGTDINVESTPGWGTNGFQPAAGCVAPCALVANAVSTDAGCPTYNDGTVTVSVISGGSGNYTYLWSNGATTANVTGLTAGLYTVTVTDLNGCTTTASATVNNSVSGPVHNINTGLNYCTIQAAVDAAPTLNGHTITVDAGTYDEDVNVNKTLSIIGSGAGSTSIRGIFGGDGATVRISANNVEIAGFTITRLGNNTTDWNDPTLNSAGIAIQGTSISGALIRDNIITGNRTGIDINNSSTHTIRNNDITFNRTGLIFRNQTDNLTIVENNINDNWTIGVLFLDASVGSNVPVQTALNSNIHNNNISGNWYGQIQDRQSGGALPAPGTNLKNFTCNWYGTTSPVKTNVNTTEPGYAAQIPVAYGGSAVPPGGQPDIEGTASDNLVYVPYLISGTDVNVESTPGWGTNGFQPAAGCSAPCDLVVTPSSTPATCPSFNNGTASVSVTGGSGNYSYLWNTGETTSSIVSLVAGNYSVVITDLNGCTATENITVSSTYASPVLPPDGSSTVECAQVPVPPVVTDVCGNVIIPSVAVTGTYAGCEGTQIYTYTYTDIFGTSVNWTYTYTVDHTTSPVVPSNESATVQSKSEAVPPPTPAVTDVCGATINPVLVSIVESPDPLICEGTRTYNYSYTDCSGLTSAWSFTYTVNIDDHDACTIDACNSATGVITHTQVDRNDGNACTFDGCDAVNGVFHIPFNTNDGNACTTDECNTLTGAITHTPVNTDDGNACTIDGCNSITGEFHNPVATDDNDVCTVDGCDPVNGIFHSQVNTDDNDACTIDGCNSVSGIFHNPVSVDDNNLCTTDGCESIGGVFHTPVDTDDENACTIDDCDPLNGISHVAVNTDDGNACTTDGCNTITGIFHNPVTVDDGNACTFDGCDAVNGVFHLPVNTDDNDACTIDGCNSVSGIFHNAVNVDDNNLCTNDGCESVGGVFHNPVSTDDGNPCTIDACNPLTGVSHTAVNVDDGNACTADACNSSTGAITHIPAVTDDGNACTDDACNPATGDITHTAINTEDGNACTTDGCNTLTGEFHTPVAVDDGNACTFDGCDPVTGVFHNLINTDDNDACTADGCNTTIGVFHNPVNVDDNNLCTTDGCESIGGVFHTPVSTNDGNSCTIDVCDALTGISHIAINTDDGNACTTDACNSTTGAITHVPVNTDDNDACTEDACNPATGVISHTVLNTDDGSVCTTDGCDSSTGVYHNAISTDDGNSCTIDGCDPVNGPYHVPVDINDNNACTTDACNTSNGNITHTAINTDDGNVCTVDGCDQVTGAFHTPVAIDDGNACTNDGCDVISGVYHNPVIIDDGNPCTLDACDTSTGAITHTDASPVVTATAGTISCYGGTTCVTVTATGGLPPYIGTGVLCGYGMGTYTFDVSDSKGCVVTSAMVNISEPSKLTLSASSTPASCASSNGTASVTVSGGTPAYNYLWTPGGQTTNPATGLAPGNYSVSVTDANGCNASTNVVVGSAGTPPAAPAVITGPGGVCKKSTGIVYCVDPVVPGATSYTWTLPAGATIQGSATGACITVKFSTKFKGGFICAKANNPCGSSTYTCKNVVLITASPVTPVSVTGPSSLCPNTSANYSIAAVTNATSYTWSISGQLTILSGQGTTSVVVKALPGFTGGSVKVKAVNCKGNSGTRSKNVGPGVGCRTAADGIRNSEDITNYELSELTAYPNPTSGKFRISFQSDRKTKYTLRVVNILGSTLVNEDLPVVEGYNMKEINLENVARGIYFIKIQAEGTDTKTLRLIVE